MTPADELRAAAKTVRTWVTEEPPAGWAPTAITAFGPSLADWLEQAAHHYECGIRAADDVFRDDPAGREAFLTTGPGAPSPHALAVARAILGDQP